MGGGTIYAIKKISDQIANGDAFATAFGDVIAVPRELAVDRKTGFDRGEDRREATDRRGKHTHHSHPVRTQGDEAGL